MEAIGLPDHGDTVSKDRCCVCGEPAEGDYWLARADWDGEYVDDICCACARKLSPAKVAAEELREAEATARYETANALHRELRAAKTRAERKAVLTRARELGFPWGT